MLSIPSLAIGTAAAGTAGMAGRAGDGTAALLHTANTAALRTITDYNLVQDICNMCNVMVIDIKEKNRDYLKK